MVDGGATTGTRTLSSGFPANRLVTQITAFSNEELKPGVFRIPRDDVHAVMAAVGVQERAEDVVQERHGGDVGVGDRS